MVACHECGAVYERNPIAPGAKASCTRCDSELYREIDRSLDKSLALYCTTLVLMLIANTYPFLVMKTAGIREENQVFSSAWALYEFGMGELGLVVLMTSIVFPLTVVLSMLYLLVPVKFGYLPAGHGFVFRIIRALEPWSLLGVFMLGTMISIVKLQKLATIVPGLGIFAFVGMLVSYTAARIYFDPEIIWRLSKVRQLRANEVDSNSLCLSCHACGLIRASSDGDVDCPRCGAAMHHRLIDSLQRTTALVMSAVVFLIPANIFPVMTVKTLGRGSPDTIISGVIKLMDGGLWGLAIIVLVASIVVPILKIGALCYLLISVHRQSTWRPGDRTRLFRITEVIGAWSMVDVFLVGLLAGLVKLGLVATIEPGIGATFFAGAVILTMLAAHSFDPRLIWDKALGTNHGQAIANDTLNGSNNDPDDDSYNSIDNTNEKGSEHNADVKTSSHIQVTN